MLNDLNYPYPQHTWLSDDDIHVIGFAFYEGKIIEKKTLSSYFLGVETNLEFEQALSQIDGNFAVWIDHKNYTAAAVDRIRSIPILYTFQENELQNVDPSNIEKVTASKAAAEHLKYAWCVLGNDTLLADVNQLQAGQYIFHTKKEKGQPKFYFHHFEVEKQPFTEVEEAFAIFEDAFNKYMPLLADKQIVIPLSGGYDSRLILAKMVAAKHPNILAYTYGKENSHEVKIAKKTCKQLNVNWEFIPYDSGVFDEFFSENWQTYSNQNHFYSSLPHEQDFFALNELQKAGKLEEGFVALPGFCGDLLGGSITAYSPNSFSFEGLKDFIKERHFQGNDLSFESLEESNVTDENTFYDAYQHWFVCNKVSKFIVNSVRVYEHFGGTWQLPLWDEKLIQYWYSVPYTERKKQAFYNQVLFEKYFEPHQIDFKKPGFDDNYPNRVKEAIKKTLPKEVVKSFKKVKASKKSNDVNNLLILNKRIQQSIGGEGSPLEINNTHALYFLKNLNL